MEGNQQCRERLGDEDDGGGALNFYASKAGMVRRRKRQTFCKLI